MRLPGVLTAALAVASCGFVEEGACVVDASVEAVAVGVPDGAVGASSELALMHVGQVVDVCMIGTDSCTRVDQRFEFQTDAPSVVTIVMNASVVSDGCSQLTSTHAYPGGYVRSGRLTASSVGTARIQAALLRGDAVEQTAGLIWCTPFGAGAGCRPLAGIQVTP